MLARVYKKKKRPLTQGDGGDGGGGGGGAAYYDDGMPHTTMQQYANGGGGGGQPTRSRSSRTSRAFGGAEKERKHHHGSGLVKKVFGRKDRSDSTKYGPPPPMRADRGGVIYSDDDEGEYDDDGVEDEEEEEEPQMLRHRRRFVRSGLTTYEQCISKNSGGRRFSRRSYLPSSISTSNVPSPSVSDPVKGVIVVDKENSPVTVNQSPVEKTVGISSLSSALQDVIYTNPTALKSVVDPSAGPARVQRSFVVEQTPDGNLFVASKRVPSGPTRQTMDDSFIGLHRPHHQQDPFVPSAAIGHATAAGTVRHSEMDFVYRQKHGLPSTVSTGPGATTGASSAASLLSMSKVGGVRRRVSGADVAPAAPLGGDSLSNVPTATAAAAPRLRRSSSSSKIADLALVNQMATMFTDQPRQRSRSRSTDGQKLPIMPLRKDSTAMLLQRGSFEDVDALPAMTMDDLYERKPSIDKGPMTIDEFMFDAPPAPIPPPPPLQRKGSNGKSGRRRASRPTPKDDEEEEEDNVLMQSFRNVKDVDALKRSRSLEEEEKVVTTTEETETEEEYPDYAEERATDDLGSSYEDESAVRTSNITEFLGGFKSRSSLSRNSLGGRNSLGRNSMNKNDFVARAARSLRNSRKAAQETANVSSELSRKLREARARVPHDLRGDPPAPAKKRSGFRGRDNKRVRFDMTRYCREFEVIEPEYSDDEVKQWARRDSEQDDDDDEEYDDDEHSTDDDSVEFGVPIPGAVLAAAMTDANTYYANTPLNYTYPARFSAARGNASAQEMRYSVGQQDPLPPPRASGVGHEDKRVSIMSRRSQANQFEVFM